ncbi:MAG: HEAT repeat domain-containing protein [Minicystis sp.]
MATRRSFDDKRARIAELASAPEAVAAAELRKYLGDKNGYLCGEAAAVAQERDMRELIPDLAASFERLLPGGGDADKGCFGKKRILEALLHFEAGVTSVYLAGLRHTQFEPAFPKAVDTAGPIRGLSAHALVQIDHHAALLEIAPLLVDPEPIVRSEAARALARSGLEPAAAVLHLKALTGDPEPDVVEACYEGLLRLAAQRYLPVVAAGLRAEDANRAEAAALALGESRLREALPLLREALADAEGPRERQGLIMAIGLLRSDEANAVLLGLVERAPEAQAVAAINALALHRHDTAIADRVRAAVAARGSRRLAETLRDRFG